jgi:hypothetical protein
MSNTESPAGVELRPPPRPMPRKAQMALAVAAGAPLIFSGAACTAMAGRDASNDDAYTAVSCHHRRPQRFYQRSAHRRPSPKGCRASGPAFFSTALFQLAI